MNKTIATILTSVLLAAGVFAGGWFLSRYYNDKPAAPVTPVTPGGVIDEQGNDLTQGVHRLPKAMTFLAANTAGVQLEAVFEPADAVDEWEWSAAFGNPASAWATGKTVSAFVSVTPAADGSKRATVACSAPFGEVVNISVASRQHPEVSASFPVHYMKRIESVALTGSETTAGAVSVAASGVLAARTGETYTGLRFVPAYGIGTVAPVIGNAEIARRIASGVKTALTTYGEGLLTPDMLGPEIASAAYGTELTLPDLTINDIFKGFDEAANPYGIAVPNVNMMGNTDMQNVLGRVLAGLEANAETAKKAVIALRLTLPYSYSTVSETYKANYYVTVASDSVRVYATNVTIGGGPVTF